MHSSYFELTSRTPGGVLGFLSNAQNRECFHSHPQTKSSLRVRNNKYHPRLNKYRLPQATLSALPSHTSLCICRKRTEPFHAQRVIFIDVLVSELRNHGEIDRHPDCPPENRHRKRCAHSLSLMITNCFHSLTLFTGTSFWKTPQSPFRFSRTKGRGERMPPAPEGPLPGQAAHREEQA